MDAIDVSVISIIWISGTGWSWSMDVGENGSIVKFNADRTGYAFWDKCYRPYGFIITRFWISQITSAVNWF
jgi:hypothetical protein